MFSRSLALALVAIGLLVVPACSGSAPTQKAEVAKPEAPKAEAAQPAEAKPAESAPTGDLSKPFKLEVVPDAAAKAALEKAGEGIVVSVHFSDPNAGGDDQGYREQTHELSAAGGTVEVGAMDLSPAKPGGGRLSSMYVNTYSARKSAPNNLLDCTLVSGDAGSLQDSYRVDCKLL